MSFKDQITPSVVNFEMQFGNIFTKHMKDIVVAVSVRAEGIGYIDELLTIGNIVEYLYAVFDFAVIGIGDGDADRGRVGATSGRTHC